MQLRGTAWSAISALCFVAPSIVSAQGVYPNPHYNVLRGNNGESPCNLQETLVSCPQDVKTTPPVSLNLTTRAAPETAANVCMCNYVAFNIWSACRYQLGYPEAPVYSDLMNACKSASVDTGRSLELAIRPGALGIDVPEWARVHISFPGEGSTFDMHTAIMFAIRSNPEQFGEWFSFGGSCRSWSTPQIVLPIVTAIVSGLLVALVVFLIGRIKRRRASLASGCSCRSTTSSSSIASFSTGENIDRGYHM